MAESWIEIDAQDDDNDTKDDEINKDSNFKTNWHKSVESFEDMDLNKDLLKGIYHHGWHKPSDIQRRAIMPTILKHDIMIQSQSKNDKIGIMSISSLQRVDVNNSSCQVLILLPNKQQATQIFNVIRSLSSFMKGLTTYLCISSNPVRTDIKELAQGKHIVIGTNGRIADMISRGALRLTSADLLIINDADIMLSEKFKAQIYDIFQYLPSKIQVGLFFSKMPEQILQLTKRFMRDPVQISGNDAVKQWYIEYDLPRVTPKKRIKH